MAAPKGNNYYTLRKRSGRKRIFEDPADMEAAIEEYIQDCQDNPLYSTEQKKGNTVIPKGYKGKIPDSLVDIPLSRPFTLAGLCVYMGTSRAYWNAFRSNLKPDESSIDKDFLDVITRTEEMFYQQKFEGATIGKFNANIIARDLGLVDKQELTVSDDSKITVSVSGKDIKLM